MRIGIYTGQTSPSAGGAYTLIETIKKDIVRIKSSHEIVLFYESTLPAAEYLEDGIRYIRLPMTPKTGLRFRLRRKILTLIGRYNEDKKLDRALHRSQIDIVWFLGPYDIEVSVPYVFTVWDLGHRTQPSFPEVSIAGWKWDARERTYQRMLYRASYVITGNEAGKKEILDNYPMNPDKIKVVPFPIPSFCFESLDVPQTLEKVDKPFIFYPAQFWSHKNHVRLIEAIQYLRDERDIKLNCYFVGSDKGNLAYIERLIQDSGLTNQMCNLGFVDTATLRYLYNNALAMTFVSLLGPNNLPPLEAAALGCPVIISDLPGHIEQMEGAALPVDATSYEKIAEALQLLLENKSYRNELIQRGNELAAKYRDYSYYSQMLSIFNDFSLLRKTWE